MRQEIVNLKLKNIRNRFKELAHRPDNWDERGSKAVNIDSLIEAIFLMNSLWETAYVKELGAPFIGSDENGNIDIEYKFDGRDLHFEVEPNRIDYLKMWGPRIKEDMEFGDLKDVELVDLFEWLVCG